MSSHSGRCCVEKGHRGGREQMCQVLSLISRDAQQYGGSSPDVGIDIPLDLFIIKNLMGVHRGKACTDMA